MNWSEIFKMKQKGGSIKMEEQKTAMPAEIVKKMKEKLEGIDKSQLATGQAEDGSCEDYWWSPVCITLCAPLSGLPFNLDFSLESVDCNYDGHCNTPQVFVDGEQICVVLPGTVVYTVIVNDDMSISCSYAGFYYEAL
ncbi:hypothetical protein [Mesobacillus jeotgali]|uniref:hypothetical protein n=1 Tax=Mesobacillus jeotgali TaxID=129985 RepID=UPI0009A8C8EC|nr:hypothetical protein [Mesobacillus jeotgali]